MECSGNHPEWHIKDNVLPLLNGNCSFKTMDGKEHNIDGKWDMILAFPPCTVISCNGYGAVCEFDEDSRGRTVATPYYCRCYRSKMSSYCKKLTNRKVRRYKGEIHKGGNYRRVFDMWWKLD